MVAPHAGHYRRHAVERSFVDICPFDAGKILTREDRMSVAEEDRVHARHFAQVVNRVFRHHLIRIGREARVGDNDHNIRPFFTHLRYVFTRRFGDVVNGNFAGEIGFIPGHDLGRYKADVANFQRLLFTVLINNLGLFNQIRGEKRLFGLNVDDIGVNVREFCACQRIVQVFKTIVEFVVTEVADGIIQGVHRFIHRVDLAFFQPLCRHVVTQRTPLNQITVVDQHAIFYFIAGGIDQTCRAYQSEFFRRGIFVVIEVHHIAVQIGRFQNTQIYRRRLHARCNQRRQERCAKLNHQRSPFFDPGHKRICIYRLLLTEV